VTSCDTEAKYVSSRNNFPIYPVLALPSIFEDGSWEYTCLASHITSCNSPQIPLKSLLPKITDALCMELVMATPPTHPPAEKKSSSTLPSAGCGPAKCLIILHIGKNSGICLSHYPERRCWREAALQHQHPKTSTCRPRCKQQAVPSSVPSRLLRLCSEGHNQGKT